VATQAPAASFPPMSPLTGDERDVRLVLTHTMVLKLSHEVVVSLMRWLFRKQRTLSLSLLSLIHIIKNPMWHCMGRPMGPLTCTNL
jgi:hypothetical protein